MENQNGHTKEKPDLMRLIQTVLLTLITAALIGFYTKMQDLNDRLIRIEERAVTNTDNINNCQQALNRIQMEQMKASDRMSRLEFQISEREK